MSESEGKKLTVLIPQTLYEQAVTAMVRDSWKFQKLFVYLLQRWVSESSGEGIQAHKNSQNPIAAPDKELQQVIDFWAVAPKEDRHIVLSIVKRWLPDEPGESSKKLNEKRR